MKRLKKRSRTDSQPVELPRMRRHNWDRTIYIGLLVVFLGGLGNYVAGDRIFLRADGLVLRDHSEIGATSLVEVTEVAVRPGQVVEEGDMLVRAESLATVGRLAELSIREAELVERGARLRSELALARELRPEAEARLAKLNDRQAMIDTLDTSRLVSADRKDAMSSTRHGAAVEAATLAARIEGLSEEIAVLDDSRSHAAAAVLDLRTRYRDGIHRAGTRGVVGDHVPAPGEVLNPGETILTIHWGDPYVLAYLPQRYLFDISAGERVTVRAGKRTRGGTIRAILPMSTAIPDEFRNAFRTRETRQLARIALEPGPDLPAMAAVRITRDRNLPGLITTAEMAMDGSIDLGQSAMRAARALWDDVEGRITALTDGALDMEADPKTGALPLALDMPSTTRPNPL